MILFFIELWRGFPLLFSCNSLLSLLDYLDR
nr:MAG TPA: hypothetical protein [Caudoviricetes sp.]